MNSPGRPAWQNRIEFEYGVTDRFTASAYLNFIQSSDGESASRFDGASLEFIYRLIGTIL